MMTAAGGEGPNVEEIFSNYTYEGFQASTMNVVNNIDLSTEGGAVFIKNFSNNSNKPIVQDTENGTSQHWESNSNSAYISASNCVTAFNTNGFSLGNNSKVKTYGQKYHTHTFRKCPKFFDVVKFTGNGTARTISHSLGTAPGFMILKSSAGYDSYIYHRSLGATKYMRWNETDAPYAQSAYWNDTEPTASTFSVGTGNPVNRNGDTITAYLFAHNNNDGGFGANGDLDIIKCDEYTGNGSNDGPAINLGFEPQYLIIKPQYGLGWQSNVEDWIILDSLNRSFSSPPDKVDFWYDNNKNTNFRKSGHRISANATGFKIDDDDNQFNYSGRKYIYIAIRRPTKVPEDASTVFAIDSFTRPTDNTDALPCFSSNNFEVDLAIDKTTDQTFNWKVHWRSSGGREVTTNNKNEVNQSASSANFNYSNGYFFDYQATDADRLGWMWKRAPGFCDVLTYTGDGTAGRTINHSLRAVPEMIWVKSWDTAHPWAVYHKNMDSSAPEDYAMSLDSSSPRVDDTGWWNDTAPTETVFSVGNKSTGPNVNGDYYVAMLFASVDGVSKCGTYTGNNSTNGSTQNIDCGFSNGTKFVFIKPIDANDSWFVFDTTRGLVAGNDSVMTLDNSDAAYTTNDEIDPLNSGFTVVQRNASLNLNGRVFIFYAIAA